ncbi:structural maintenance of chromosomes protein 5 [Nilaparvata lugens]|uniref:structural maintenance of chromosomes protein 5 n=1 Tax=Nilaparvata lugens TaxID=108931 RepID=UPI00193C9274|nr:structural maintenance of chromosomes protein 5 [Nilaparvata lugens]
MAEGYIVRLSLRNFMTFDDVTFLPSNRLNLVIGPNGSGKSSLSCAMVLGLAGKTKILGRAPEVGQFVKRGKQKAEIEIELYKKNNNNITVRRTMTIDNKTSWHLNDKPASQKEIEDLMKSLQIQVDNLCQFLPQDRVHDFAKMNKQELLDNTQKSVGSPKLYQMFNELKNNMKLDGNHEKDVQKIKDQILRSEDQVEK